MNRLLGSSHVYFLYPFICRRGPFAYHLFFAVAMRGCLRLNCTPVQLPVLMHSAHYSRLLMQKD